MGGRGGIGGRAGGGGYLHCPSNCCASEQPGTDLKVPVKFPSAPLVAMVERAAGVEGLEVAALGAAPFGGLGGGLTAGVAAR